tara:strand:- start:584 stop:889 length:306 start_codon:yes stop_codon:yes gene_type:complete
MKTISDIESDKVESEGSIQNVIPKGKKVVLTNAEILNGKFGEYGLITLKEGTKEHIVNTSSVALVESLKRMISNGLGKGDTFEVSLAVRTSKEDREYFVFE